MIRTINVIAAGLFATAALATSGAVVAQESRPGVAVLPFENGGSYGKDREEFDALRRGLAGMLTFELGQHAAIRLVDRAEIQRLLDAQGLAVAERVDAATAAKIGKQAGARFIIAGMFIDLYGDFRVDARIINVETGEILKVVRSDPKLRDRKDMSRIIQSVADRILEDTKLSALPAGSRPAPAAVPADAIALYSRALLFQDRGDKAKALEFYRKALVVFPEYAAAAEGLRRLGES
jgi:TolB-like protein